jgi:hypothetical protein
MDLCRGQSSRFEADLVVHIRNLPIYCRPRPTNHQSTSPRTSYNGIEINTRSCLSKLGLINVDALTKSRPAILGCRWWFCPLRTRAKDLVFNGPWLTDTQSAQHIAHPLRVHPTGRHVRQIPLLDLRIKALDAFIILLLRIEPQAVSEKQRRGFVR